MTKFYRKVFVVIGQLKKMVTQLIKVTFLISQVYTTIRQNYILRIISWQKSLFIFQQKMHPNNKISLNL